MPGMPRRSIGGENAAEPMAKTRPTGVRSPLACPGKSGTAASTQTITRPASSVITPKVARHPIRSARSVPTGVPIASAIGVPASAMVRALPCWCGATMRRA